MSVLRFQPVPMKFGVTQDEGTHPFVLPQPLLQSLTNGRAVKSGAIKKRPGWAPLCTVGAFSQLFSVNETLMVASPSASSGVPVRKLSLVNRLGTVSPRSDSVSGVAGLRSLPEIDVLERKNVWRDSSALGSGVTNPYSAAADHAIDPLSGIEVIAWTNRRGSLFAVSAMALDSETRESVTNARIIQSPTTLDCHRPRVLALPAAGQIVVCYQREGANELRAIIYDTAARTWGTDTVVASNLHGTPSWDAYASGSVWYLAYRSTTPNITLLKMSGVTVAATVTVAEDPTRAIGVHADSTNAFVWVGYYLAGTGMRVLARNSVTIATVVLVPTTLEIPTDNPTQIAFCTLTASQVLATWTTSGNGTIATDNYGREQTKYRTVTTAGVLGTQCNRASFELISRPWLATNGHVYVNVLYDGSSNNTPTLPEGKRSFGFATAFTMRVTHATAASTGADNFSWQPCASWAIGSAGMSRRAGAYSGSSYSASSLSNVTASSVATSGSTSLGATEYRFMLCTEVPIGISTAVLGGVIAGASGVDMCRLNISVANIITQYAVSLGRNVVFSGGIPTVFDGELLTEYGFLVPPENGRGVASASGFSTLSPGDLAISAVAEYTLATGDVVRSAPAPVLGPTHPYTITVALNDKVTVGVPSIGLTNKFSDVSGMSDVMAAQIRLYRTEANGTILRAETSTEAWGSVANLAMQRLTNQSVIAQSLDTDLLTHPVLYTTDGILPNYPLPALSHLVNHANRIMGISAEDRRVLVFTHTYEPGELPGWNPLLQIQLPEEMVALASMDEKLVILCKHGVYIMGGDGPDRKGLNSNFVGPDRLNGPHGCVSATSVVVIPLGVIWQAPTGMMMLDRKFGITRIGGPVEDTLAAYPVCLESSAWPAKEWAYWSLADSAITGFRGICFDWRNNVWSVDIVQITGEGPTYPPVVCAIRSFAVLGDAMYGTANVGLSLYQHTGYDDPATVPGHEAWITLYMITAWINLGQVSLFQRVRSISVLAEYHSSHQLSVATDLDHGLSSNTFTWSNVALAALNSYEQLWHHMRNQRCSSMQVYIRDEQGTAVSPFGAGASFVGVSLEIGFKAGTPKLSGPHLK